MSHGPPHDHHRAVSDDEVEELAVRGGPRDADEALHADWEADVVGSVKGLQDQTRGRQPARHGGSQVRSTPATGPDDVAWGAGSWGSALDRPVDVVIADVAKHPGHQHQVSRDRPDVRAEAPP